MYASFFNRLFFYVQLTLQRLNITPPLWMSLQLVGTSRVSFLDQQQSLVLTKIVTSTGQDHNRPSKYDLAEQRLTDILLHHEHEDNTLRIADVHLTENAKHIIKSLTNNTTGSNTMPLTKQIGVSFLTIHITTPYNEFYRNHLFSFFDEIDNKCGVKYNVLEVVKNKEDGSTRIYLQSANGKTLWNFLLSQDMAKFEINDVFIQ